MNTTLIVALVAVAAFLLMKFMGRGDLKGADARKLVEGGARLLDVRSPGEFASGHVPGAINVPLDALERRLGEVGPKERTVVVYCASGARSAAAKRVLMSKGYADVKNLGPMSAW